MFLTVVFLILRVLCLSTGMHFPHNDVKVKLSSELNKGLLKALVKPDSLSASMKGPLALSVHYNYLFPLKVNVTHQSEDMESCNKLYQKGYTVIGVYVIKPNGYKTIKVYCNMKDGGWTVFQRRINGVVDFYRTWKEYKNGFGNITGEFWLGNDALYFLTKTGSCQLRIEMEDFSNVTKYAVYDKFKVYPENNGYKLSIGKYDGNAGDSLKMHNGQKFSTKDKDLDSDGTHCAQRHKGGWWFNGCIYSHLNGPYLGGKHKSFADGIHWYHWHGFYYSLKATAMMMKCA